MINIEFICDYCKKVILTDTIKDYLNFSKEIYNILDKRKKEYKFDTDIKLACMKCFKKNLKESGIKWETLNAKNHAEK